ncbi:MAG: glycosyltransferase family 39 protein [Deltaproteobacteria bacterium]|nr:glycosyltransferase family 39 protein [Deltaproteobacteria bacterium]
MIATLSSFMASSLIGACILTFFLPKNAKPSVGHFVLYLALAFGLGVAVSSLILFVFLHFSPIKFFPLFEVACALLFAIVVMLKFPVKILWLPSRPQNITIPETILSVIIVAAFAIVLLVYLIYFPLEPHGKWDAWASWNSAARFIYGSMGIVDSYQTFWKTLGAQSSYPWLYPLSVAKAWAYGGQVEQAAPLVFNALFGLAISGVVFGFLCTVKGRLTGLFAVLFLLGCPFFSLHILAQYADIALAYYFVAALVTLCLATDKEHGKFLALLGAFATIAAWTKDEGLLFLLVIFLVFCIYVGRDYASEKRLKDSGTKVLLFLGGALPGLLLLFYHKVFFIERASSFLSEQSRALIDFILDLDRYATVVTAFIKEAFLFSVANVTFMSSGIVLLIIYALVVGREKVVSWRSPLALPAVVTLLMLGGYFAVFIITPAPLQWHLDTLLNRLYLQLFPLMIVAFLAMLKAPDAIFREKVFLDLPPKTMPLNKNKRKTRR